MSDRFVSNRFVAASWRPGADVAVLDRLRSLTSGWTVVSGEGWLIASEKPAAIATAGSVTLALGRRQAFDRAGERMADAATLAAEVAGAGEGVLAGMASPFRAAWADAAGGVVRATVDALGIGHVFLGAPEAVAVVSSSATLLGDVLAAPLSLEALAAYAIYGNFLVEESPFAGVSRLPAGHLAVLENGRVETRSASAPAARLASPDEALRAAVAAMQKAAPDAELELSGGLDSRMILAGMAASSRQGLRAVTIGVAADPSGDVKVAQSIAAAEGLDWSVLEVGGVADLDADRLAELLASAVAGYDHMANPLEKTALMMAGHGRQVSARFSGQNGEILRGFYYPRQPLAAAPSEALARRLVALRVAVNDRVDGALLSPAVRGELVAAAETRLVRQMLEFGGSWGQTLDRLYIDHRMQNWVGNAASSRLIEHVPLYPFFDADFIAAALAAPAGEKLNSRAAYRMLMALDPSLARRPLADGITPAALPKSALGAKIADLRLDLSRVTDRLGRRLRRAAKPTLGAATAAEQWRRLDLHRRLPVHALAKSDLFDEAALERIATGAWLPDRPTLGFLLVAAGLVERA